MEWVQWRKKVPYFLIMSLIPLFGKSTKNEWFLRSHKNKTRRRSLNKTVIYFGLKTKIVWTAHYKGNVKKYFAKAQWSLSYSTLNMYMASPSNERQRGKIILLTREEISLFPRKNKQTKEIKDPSCRKMTDCTLTKHFGLVLNHRERNEIIWHRRHKRMAADWVPAV